MAKAIVTPRQRQGSSMNDRSNSCQCDSDKSRFVPGLEFHYAYFFSASEKKFLISGKQLVTDGVP